MSGKLIVFEGTDGSGKSTQFKLAKQALTLGAQEVRTMVFPRYQEESSALVRMYLSGRFGKDPSDVNAYAASTFYAVDRYAGYKQDWGSYYENGGLLLADRYTTSNAVHQASKLQTLERPEFFRWLADFEYDRLGLPRPDLVLWMDMPIDRTIENLRRREADTHTTADIHEVDADYLGSCYEAASQAAEFYGWQRISCVDQTGAVRPIPEIHAEIMQILDKIR
jgi:dTMP kinase